MEVLSGTDRFVALLRQKLAERAQVKGASRARGAATTKTKAGPPHLVVASVAHAGADDRHLRRAIVEQLLSDHFGSQLANEPRFQQIVERVSEIIAEDAELGAVMGSVMAEVRR